jgi:hypothetical protein
LNYRIEKANLGWMKRELAWEIRCSHLCFRAFHKAGGLFCFNIL